MGGPRRRSGALGGEVVSAPAVCCWNARGGLDRGPSASRLAGSGLGASGSRGGECGGGEALNTRLRAPGELRAGGLGLVVYGRQAEPC